MIVKTKMLAGYLRKLWIRIFIFTVVLATYLAHKDWLSAFFSPPFEGGVTPLRLLWLMFMAMMLRHLFPAGHSTMALKKSERNTYVQEEGYEKEKLAQFVREQNRRAGLVMLSWLAANSVFAVLYLRRILDKEDLLMLTVFYFLCDYICILFYCPFQSLIMHNKCCVNCRIYDWGHVMMFLPMALVRSFFSRSLFITSCIVLARWEVCFAKYPERFWSGSNQALQCGSCQDKTCQIKKRIVAKT